MADGEFKPGEMDITAQEKTFDGFVSLTTKSVVAIIVALILLAFINV